MVTKKKTTTPENSSEAPVKKPRSPRTKKTASEGSASEKKPRAPRKKEVKPQNEVFYENDTSDLHGTDEDGTLIAGDAFVTVKQESLYKVLTQEKEISGPPRYFTTDWLAAWDSVKKLKSLQPTVAITGHGLPMRDEELTTNLQKLVIEFEQIALPKQGKYLN